ncbi:hypothetical protein [Streptomyces sp. NPDC048266]|uniref:hypothetical protein n=1 Tax=Streptomyces sp. NPDC048266 TaxID=3155787 RepID=UPI0033E86388
MTTAQHRQNAVLSKILVVCDRTNDGRIARLTVEELAGQASDTRGVFDNVVWSR